MLLSFQRPSHLFWEGVPSRQARPEPIGPERTSEYSAECRPARARPDVLAAPDPAGAGYDS